MAPLYPEHTASPPRRPGGSVFHQKRRHFFPDLASHPVNQRVVVGTFDYPELLPSRKALMEFAAETRRNNLVVLGQDHGDRTRIIGQMTLVVVVIPEQQAHGQEGEMGGTDIAQSSKRGQQYQPFNGLGTLPRQPARHAPAKRFAQEVHRPFALFQKLIQSGGRAFGKDLLRGTTLASAIAGIFEQVNLPGTARVHGPEKMRIILPVQRMARIPVKHDEPVGRIPPLLFPASELSPGQTPGRQTQFLRLGLKIGQFACRRIVDIHPLKHPHQNHQPHVNQDDKSDDAENG